MIATLLIWIVLHPIHIGILNMEINPKTKQIELEIRLFTDDLEEAVFKSSGKRLYFGTAKQHPAVDSLLEVFVRKNMLVNNFGQPLKWNWIGYTHVADVTELFLESEEIKMPYLLNIKSKFMFDLFDDQKNILNFKYKDFKKSHLFTDKQQNVNIVSP